MLDGVMRRVKEWFFRPLAALFERAPPLWLTLIGLGLGLATAVLLAMQQYVWGFAGWFLNRLFDGLDGAVARRRGLQSDLGGYLDILFDFVVYAAIPVGLVWGRPLLVNWMALVFLLAVFYVNAASWMYLSAVLEKRRQGAGAQGEETTVTMPDGLIGGTATILFYTAFIFRPDYLALLLTVMGVLVIVTIGQRLVWAARHL